LGALALRPGPATAAPAVNSIIPAGPTTILNDGGALCALLPSGDAQCWGQGSTQGVFPGPYVAVAPGEFHVCALTRPARPTAGARAAAVRPRTSPAPTSRSAAAGAIPAP